MTGRYLWPLTRRFDLIYLISKGLVPIASAVIGLMLLIPTTSAETPKDCLALEPNQPQIVHEGRYNILCVRPPPGPLDLRCTVDGVSGPSRLATHPYRVDGAVPQTIEIDSERPLAPLHGTARDGAHVFFSYDGPFYPVRDGYRLTCRW